MYQDLEDKAKTEIISEIFAIPLSAMLGVWLLGEMYWLSVLLSVIFFKIWISNMCDDILLLG